MGLITSRFKSKKTTVQVLEELEKFWAGICGFRKAQFRDVLLEMYKRPGVYDSQAIPKNIKKMQSNQVYNEQRARRIIGHLIVYSIAIYLIGALLFYYRMFRSPFKDQIIYATPLLVFPFLVIILKKFVAWYYHRKLEKSEEKLKLMKEQKEQILTDVKEKETYKVAKEILDKFGAESLSNSGEIVLTNYQSGSQSPSSFGLRRRPTGAGDPASPKQPSPLKTVAIRDTSLAAHPSGVMQQPVVQPLLPRPGNMPLVRPILPASSNFLDRLAEFIVGDGPGNRFALICNKCSAHNGMALKEEFEYLSFRCCYCSTYNPARKMKLRPPKLEDSANYSREQKSESELDSKSTSVDNDSEKESNASDENIENINSEHTIPASAVNKEYSSEELQEEVTRSAEDYTIPPVSEVVS